MHRSLELLPKVALIEVVTIKSGDLGLVQLDTTMCNYSLCCFSGVRLLSSHLICTPESNKALFKVALSSRNSCHSVSSRVIAKPVSASSAFRATISFSRCLSKHQGCHLAHQPDPLLNSKPNCTWSGLEGSTTADRKRSSLGSEISCWSLLVRGCNVLIVVVKGVCSSFTREKKFL